MSTYSRYNRIKTASGTVTLHSTTNFNNREFVFKGCEFYYDNRGRGNHEYSDNMAVTLDMGLIKNPYSVRTTAAVKIEIAVDEAMTKKIASTETLTLAASKLEYSPISDLIVAVGDGPASQKVVQEDIK